MNTARMMKAIAVSIVLGLTTIASPAVDRSVVPPDRRTVWNPGIPGGVPPDNANPSTFPGGVGPAAVYATLSPSGGDDTGAIQNALNGAGSAASKTSRRIVELNAGTFNVARALSIPSYVILRGTLGEHNTPQTVLRHTATSGSLISIWGAGDSGNWGAIRNVVGIADKGGATITLDAASDINVGDIITIDHLRDGSQNGPADGIAIYNPPNPGDWVWNNSSLWYQRQPYSTGNGTGFLFPDSDGWRLISQHCEVLAKNGNTLTIYDAATGRGSPLHTMYYLSPQVYRCAGGNPDVRRYAGLENVRLEPQGTSGHRVIVVNGAAFCWIRNIEIDGAAQPWSGRHCQLYSQTYRCEIRESYFHESGNYWQGGNAYGLNISGSEHLVENNIVMKLNKPIVLECSNGGNVIAYNYVDEAVIQSLTHDWQEAAISTHASFCHHELFEGNHTPNMGPDSTHGNNGWITMFRNWATGRNSSGYATTYNRAIFSDGWQREVSSLGNVLWRPGSVIDYLLLTPTLPSPGINPVWNAPTSVYLLGSNAWIPPGDGGGADSWDNGQAATMFHRHLDFDYKSNAQYDNSSNPVKTLPPSLYRDSKPAFFGAYDWPWINPAGATHDDRVGTLPAKARYDAGRPFADPPDAHAPPVITSQPANTTVSAGETAFFSVAASGPAPFTYRWWKDSAVISGANGTTYTTPATEIIDNGSQFQVVVTNAYGSATSSVAVLTVLPPDTTPPIVSLTAPPHGATVSNTVTVSADASDNVAVVGVQFTIDGADLGIEDTTAPYVVDWNTFGVSNGVYALAAIALDAAGNTATAATVTVVVNNFATEQTIWWDRTTTESNFDNAPWDLGMIFSPTVDGTVIAIRAHGVAGESGDHSARLWRNGDGTLLSGPHTFNYSGSGWHRLDLPVAISVTAGESYTVTVSTGTDSGRLYTSIPNDLTSGGDNGMHLTYRADAAVYSATVGVRPVESWYSENYLRDVVFVEAVFDNDSDGIPDAADPDDDNDGMPDAWEGANGTDPMTADATLDPDMDGMQNLEEYIGGTDPQDEGSRFKAHGLEVGVTGATVSFDSITGRLYKVEYNNDLATTNWLCLTNDLPGTGVPLDVIDAAMSDRRFYRITVRLPGTNRFLGPTQAVAR